MGLALSSRKPHLQGPAQRFFTAQRATGALTWTTRPRGCLGALRPPCGSARPHTWQAVSTLSESHEVCRTHVSLSRSFPGSPPHAGKSWIIETGRQAGGWCPQADFPIGKANHDKTQRPRQMTGTEWVGPGGREKGLYLLMATGSRPTSVPLKTTSLVHSVKIGSSVSAVLRFKGLWCRGPVLERTDGGA